MTPIIENLTADTVTRKIMYEYFRGWGLKQGSRRMTDYEMGKHWIADQWYTPEAYQIAVQYLAEYLRV